MPSQVTHAHTNIHACPNYRGTPTDAGFVPVDAVSLGVAIVTAHLVLLIIAVSALVVIRPDWDVVVVYSISFIQLYAGGGTRQYIIHEGILCIPN